MKKLAIGLLIAVLSSSIALAGSGTITSLDAGSVTRTYAIGTNGSGNFFGLSGICDGPACANLESVTAAGTSGTNGLAVQGMTGGVAMPVSGSVTALSSLAIPTSTLALPATTTAYGAGTLMCTSATVATCNTALASQTLTVGTAGENIGRLQLNINDSTSPGWTGQTINIDFWYAAPTFQTTGDRGVFVTDFLTGSANHIGTFTCVLGSAAGDGIYGECTPLPGNSIEVIPASSTTVFWTATAVSASGTTGASKTLTIKAEAAK